MNETTLRNLIEQAVKGSVQQALDGPVKAIIAEEIRRSNDAQVKIFEAVAVEQSYRNIEPILGFDPRDKQQAKEFHDRFQRSLKAADVICEMASGAGRKALWFTLLLLIGVIGANLTAAVGFIRGWLK